MSRSLFLKASCLLALLAAAVNAFFFPTFYQPLYVVAPVGIFYQPVAVVPVGGGFGGGGFGDGFGGGGFGGGGFVGRRVLREAASTKCRSLLDLIRSNSDLSTLASLAPLLSEPLQKELTAVPPPALTVFAPTNEALASLLAKLPIVPGETKPELLLNSTALTALLSYHIVPGAAPRAAELTNGEQLTTALTAKAGALRVEKDKNGTVTIVGRGSSARVVKADIADCAAVVHVVDAVLLPMRLS